MVTPADKIIALILNKIKNYSWYYFQLDLNRVFKENERAVINKQDTNFLDHIDFIDGHYVLTDESPAVKDSIFPCMLKYIRDYPEVLKEVTKKLFDTNSILNRSESSKGKMGELNQKDEILRNKIFDRKIKKGFRRDPAHVVILSEGDSWFEFPRIFFRLNPVKDIVDWLIDEPRYAVYSIASGGDWLSNEIYTGEYIEELPMVSPDVFLISGGGNDLVGGKRLTTMVRNLLLEGRRDLNDHDNALLKELLEIRVKSPAMDAVKFRKGLELVSNEFIQFVNICFAQYIILFSNIMSVPEYKKMLIITQGYDFALPSFTLHGGLLSVHRLLNFSLKTGNWLCRPLNMKAIADPVDQEAVIYTMINEFNEMLIKLALYQNFDNLFHIDARGTAQIQDWYDELHLTSKAFKRVADTYKQCINDNLRMQQMPKQKIYRVGEKNYSAQY